MFPRPFVEPNIWENASLYGAGAAAVTCSQLWDRSGAAELVGRAYAAPLDPTLPTDLAAARQFVIARLCQDAYLGTVDYAIANVQRAQAEAKRRPLGRRTPPASSALTVAQRLNMLDQAIALGMSQNVIDILQKQIAAATTQPTIGQHPPAAAPTTPPDAQPQPEVTVFSTEGLGKAIKQVTPTLLVVGIATGAAFAIGGALVNRYLFKEDRSK
jgi:hypothetical protein